MYNDEYRYPSSRDNTFSSEDEQSEILDKCNNMKHNDRFLADIITWVKQCKPPGSTVNSLLKILRKHTNVAFPNDYRTLLKTPTCTEVAIIDNGQYWHYGLKNSIMRLLMNCEETDYSENRHIDLLINIDGATLGKSTEKSMWPILCSDTVSKNVAVVGIFYGEGKPKNCNVFLNKFVHEATELINNGIIVNNNHYSIKLKALICDAPAKAYVLQVKNHTGFNSCTKCVVEGDYINNRVTFPGGAHNTLRTNEQFRDYAYNFDYQLGETILTKIPHFDFVKNVPLDYMHLVCLGIMRKLLFLWLNGPLTVKLSANDVNKISNRLIKLRKIIPLDFNRKPRTLKYIKLWKATELRLFLLYLGPVVLKNILQKNLYEHFLTLHVAITILASPSLSSDPLNITYAEDLLRNFTEQFETLYGEQYISHNVHNLLHLAADVREHGPLDNFSSFRFENYINILMKYVRKGEKPLQQIARRIIEYDLPVKNTKMKFSYLLEKRHYDGPLDAYCDMLYVKQYKFMRTDTFFINCDNNANSCCLLKHGLFVESVNFIRHQNTSYIIGRQLLPCGSLYSVPTDSLDVGIVIVKRQHEIKSWLCSDVKMKLIKIPYDANNKFVVLPILHTKN
ncbi:uncharacterized protein LOC118645100 [Monomorium pharaonis]|uniref:uncharacterized protein LOC118645100 n=1 Tax=Monomorium pharaonis TaxID=307658 RepID=UPI0017470902|nr:uncharacterized protein LOC118645100 [Monomorium pharaonis]